MRTPPSLRTAHFFASRTHYLLVFNLVSSRTPSCFLQSCFPVGWPSACPGTCSFFSPGTALLVEFMKLMLAHVSSLSAELWMGAWCSGEPGTHPSFVSPTNLQRVNSTPSSRSLMKMFNQTGASIDPWGPPLVTGLQIDFAPLTTTLWAGHSASLWTASLSAHWAPMSTGSL